ncbi:phosphoribosylglycinamide formyltransferase-1 [Pullulanibacillus pueri]|uniref:Phosphoribosylglycinamide formyltransferase n=1 Tax=Pullulanibacillus pueri TaxID=1437324 RepID=A0A8J2ZW77_9BACL|nr:phosphoribosylglycinamide formyltransferase [Pullulanibacillus pueri]MBM7682755.1 phosphoribosylglycinamide formyltransferase-1 [Pullulanibacillus pueri]GGH83063.1 phosphoribosylglycinamide formyltransferase [Pullulanibacillus pueri]
MKRLAIFASGTGSNFQVIAEAIRSGSIRAELVLLVCDKPDAAVIEKAEWLHIPAFVAEPKRFETKQVYEKAVLAALEEAQVDFVVLAGYMRLIGPTLLQAYGGRIINIHPSLLPSFPGLHAIEQAFAAGVKVTGITIHFVDDGMDTGPIIAQEAVKLSRGETIESLTDKIHHLEHTLYPRVIAELLNEE